MFLCINLLFIIYLFSCLIALTRNLSRICCEAFRVKSAMMLSAYLIRVALRRCVFSLVLLKKELRFLGFPYVLFVASQSNVLE